VLVEQTVEQDGMVFVWTGTGEFSEPSAAVPDLSPPAGYTIHSEITLEVPVEHGLLIENLLDLAHAPFTHTATFARGWPVPEAVKFHLREVSGTLFRERQSDRDACVHGWAPMGAAPPLATSSGRQLDSHFL